MSERKSFFSRKSLLAGGAALALIGTAGAGVITQSTVPAFAQDPLTVPEHATRAPVDFADIVEAVSPAVVSVQVESAPVQMMSGQQFGGGENLPEGHPLRRFFDQFGDQFGQQFGQRGEGGQPRQAPRHSGQGSGFIISADGYGVTNNHVVESGETVSIVLKDGSEYDAEVIGTDPKTDLALLKVEADEDLPFVKFAENTEPRVGEWVVAVGNPFGLGGTVTAGIVSARGRDIGAGPYDDFIQIDAPVNRGNSGGPTFNLKGEVIGVNTAIFSPSGGNVGIAFAIPSSTAMPVIDDLKDDGSVSRGWLGVQIQPVSEDIAASIGLDQARGAIIGETLDTGPAGEAGLKSGDVILSVDGEEIEDSRHLVHVIGNMKPDETATIEVFRDGDVEEIEVTLGAQPTGEQQVAANAQQADEQETGKLGLALAEGEDGVTVTQVRPDSESAEKGIQQGDVIVQAGGQDVTEPKDVIAAVESARKKGRDAVLLRVRSGENSRFVALSLKA